jgi:hypothetical protein
MLSSNHQETSTRKVSFDGGQLGSCTMWKTSIFKSMQYEICLFTIIMLVVKDNKAKYEKFMLRVFTFFWEISEKCIYPNLVGKVQGHRTV